jgi:hypothetical protein
VESPNQYEFLLFEQLNGLVSIDSSSEYAQVLSGRAAFDLTLLQETLSLSGVVGVNWAKCYNDYWANFELVQLDFATVDVMDCPAFTSSLIFSTVDAYADAFAALVDGSGVVSNLTSMASDNSQSVFFNHATSLGNWSDNAAVTATLYGELAMAIGSTSDFSISTVYSDADTSTAYIQWSAPISGFEIGTTFLSLDENRMIQYVSVVFMYSGTSLDATLRGDYSNGLISPGAGTVTSVMFDSHFPAFMAADVSGILVDYDESSVVNYINVNTGTVETGVGLDGVSEAFNFFFSTYWHLHMWQEIWLYRQWLYWRRRAKIHKVCV